MRWAVPGRLRRPLRLAEEVDLAQLHPVVTQDVVGRGDVEVDVREHEVLQVVPAPEAQRSAAQRQGDGALLRTVDLLGVEALEILDGPGDARLELGKAALVVLVGRRLIAREARRAALGDVGGDLDPLPGMSTIASADLPTSQTANENNAVRNGVEKDEKSNATDVSSSTSQRVSSMDASAGNSGASVWAASPAHIASASADHGTTTEVRSRA